MVNRHFGLSADPFHLSPDTRRFFGGGWRAEVLERLNDAIDRGENLLTLTGAAGTGKTLLCHMMREQLPDRIEVVYLTNLKLTHDEILTAIALDLELPLPEHCSRLQLQQHLEDYLLYCHRKQRQVLVIVDEAQHMTPRMLEEIRLLSNLETRDVKLLQMVLVGQPELDQLLSRHENHPLRERICHSFHLRPLSAIEVREYIRYQLFNAGYRNGELFTYAACRQLALSSGGQIRRLHTLASKALTAAHSANSAQIRWIDAWHARCDGRPVKRIPRFTGGMLTGAVVAALAMMIADTQHAPVAPVSKVSAGGNAGTALPPIITAARQQALSIQPAAGLPRVSQRLSASRSWLRQNADGLTVQILSSDGDDLQGIEVLLKKQHYKEIMADIYLSHSETDGQPRWNLLYGNFDNKTKALAAIADLPYEVRKYQPRVRPISALIGVRQRNEAPVNKEESG